MSQVAHERTNTKSTRRARYPHKERVTFGCSVGPNGAWIRPGQTKSNDVFKEESDVVRVLVYFLRDVPRPSFLLSRRVRTCSLRVMLFYFPIVFFTSATGAD